MQTKLSKFLNSIFKYSTIFLLSFVWTNFYFKKVWISFLVALFLTCIISIILIVLNNKKQNKLNLKAKEKKLIDECSYQFLFSDPKSVKNFYVALLNNKYKTVQEKNNIIVYNGEQKTLFLPLYHTTNLTPQDVISAYVNAKNNNVKNVIITCKNYSNEALDLANCVKDIKINLLDENLTYKYLLKPHETYPNFSIELKKVEKLKYKEIKKIAFNKTKTKNYFLSGILLAFSSFFTKYNVYYLVMASILFVFALYSNFNTSYNKVDEKSLF